VNVTGSEQGPAAGYCEHGNGPDSIKDGGFFISCSDSQKGLCCMELSNM
jgi:hypothetical protein